METINLASGMTFPWQLAADPKQRILAAATTLYLRRGIRNVTMNDIAAYLGMSKKTLYKWFASKPALVYATINAYASYVREELAKQNEQASTAIGEMVALREWLRNEFGQVHRQLFEELRHYPESALLWQEHCNTFLFTHIRNNLRWGMVQDIYRPYLDVDFLARLWLQEIEMSIAPRLLKASPMLEPAPVLLTLLEHFMAGIVNLNGYRLMLQLREAPQGE